MVAPARPPLGAQDRLRPRWTFLQLAGLLVLGLLAWRLADVLLLAFGAVLTAILLHALADPLMRRPLAVVAHVVVRHLYVEDLLGDRLPVPRAQGAGA